MGRSDLFIFLFLVHVVRSARVVFLCTRARAYVRAGARALLCVCVRACVRACQAVVFLDDVRRLCSTLRPHSNYPPRGQTPHSTHAANARRALTATGRGTKGHVPTEVGRCFGF